VVYAKFESGGRLRPARCLGALGYTVSAVDRPLDLDEFSRWREEADRARRHSQLAAAEGLHNWACFSAEQAAQLAVKGLLHGLGRAPWGHDLVGLGDKLGAAGLDVPERARDAMLRLGRHYMPARYPDAHPAGAPGSRYGQADARQALADCDAVLALVDNAWRELEG
jgi:HEPN domain-containing protein